MLAAVSCDWKTFLYCKDIFIKSFFVIDYNQIQKNKKLQRVQNEINKNEKRWKPVFGCESYDRLSQVRIAWKQSQKEVKQILVRNYSSGLLCLVPSLTTVHKTRCWPREHDRALMRSMLQHLTWVPSLFVVAWVGIKLDCASRLVCDMS